MLNGATSAVVYAAARVALGQHLLDDATAHEAGRVDAVGRRFDAMERALPRGAAPELTKLRIALTFWDAWIDARNAGWPSSEDIRQSEWPRLARLIAGDLANDRQITDPLVLTRFDVAANPSLAGRVQTLAARLRAVSPESA
jgi:hypothetical protein